MKYRKTLLAVLAGDMTIDEARAAVETHEAEHFAAEAAKWAFDLNTTIPAEDWDAILRRNWVVEARGGVYQTDPHWAPGLYWQETVKVPSGARYIVQEGYTLCARL